jgi:hypothetical protein
VVGGITGDPSTPVTPTVEIYDIAKNSWALCRPLPEARHGVQLAVVEGKLYAIGGCDKEFRAYDSVYEGIRTIS